MLGWMSSLWTLIKRAGRWVPWPSPSVCGVELTYPQQEVHRLELERFESWRRQVDSPPPRHPTYCNEGCPSSTRLPLMPSALAPLGARSYPPPWHSRVSGLGSAPAPASSPTSSPSGPEKPSAGTIEPTPSAKPSSNTTSSGWEDALLRDLDTLQARMGYLDSVTREPPKWFAELSTTAESSMIACVQYLHRTSCQVLQRLLRAP